MFSGVSSGVNGIQKEMTNLPQAHPVCSLMFLLSSMMVIIALLFCYTVDCVCI